MSVLKNLIYSDNISHITNMLSQIETAHNMSLAHKLMEIENNPAISAIQETLGRYEDILKPLHMQEVSAVERAMRDIRPSAEYMNEIMHQVKVSTSISPMISEMLRSVRISSVSEIYERYSSIMDPIQESLKGIDMELLGSVADRVLTMSEDLDLDVAAEEITTEYSRVSAQEQEKEKKPEEAETNSERQTENTAEVMRPERRNIDIKEVRAWLDTIIGILTFIITLSASQPSVSNTFNQTLQVNNYYVINMGYDVSELNMDNFRIVNCDVVVRLKHNCHSKIVEQLREGQIIRIIGKYKKWRQVVWKNEEDELCMGWIQNYNLTKFKLTRSARNIKKIKV
ncbi:hypothetical protein [Blautia obeum]|uniref:hypothetical protein n=1 Tax=Blautia obeum TaxID=40520 RepID=UPI0022E90B08|nr:hypothetical protein [Blautia obeum]